MTGHSPDATVEAIIKRVKNDGGLTTMLPSEDAQHVGEELTKRFGLSHLVRPTQQHPLPRTVASP